MARKANSLDSLFTTVTRAPTPDEFSEFDNLEELLRTPISFGDQPHHQQPAIGDETPTMDERRQLGAIHTPRSPRPQPSPMDVDPVLSLTLIEQDAHSTTGPKTLSDPLNVKIPSDPTRTYSEVVSSGIVPQKSGKIPQTSGNMPNSSGVNPPGESKSSQGSLLPCPIEGQTAENQGCVALSSGTQASGVNPTPSDNAPSGSRPAPSESNLPFPVSKLIWNPYSIFLPKESANLPSDSAPQTQKSQLTCPIEGHAAETSENPRTPAPAELNVSNISDSTFPFGSPQTVIEHPFGSPKKSTAEAQHPISGVETNPSDRSPILPSGEQPINEVSSQPPVFQASSKPAIKRATNQQTNSQTVVHQRPTKSDTKPTRKEPEGRMSYTDKLKRQHNLEQNFNPSDPQFVEDLVYSLTREGNVWTKVSPREFQIPHFGNLSERHTNRKVIQVDNPDRFFTRRLDGLYAVKSQSNRLRIKWQDAQRGLY